MCPVHLLAKNKEQEIKLCEPPMGSVWSLHILSLLIIAAAQTAAEAKKSPSRDLLSLFPANGATPGFVSLLHHQRVFFFF